MFDRFKTFEELVQQYNEGVEVENYAVKNSGTEQQGQKRNDFIESSCIRFRFVDTVEPWDTHTFGFILRQDTGRTRLALRPEVVVLTSPTVACKDINMLPSEVRHLLVKFLDNVEQWARGNIAFFSEAVPEGLVEHEPS